jgi:glycosyltransferase involved in cell wall biosynthesis
MVRITVITSLYNCQLYLESFLDAVGKLTNSEEVEVLLIHNSPSPAEMAIIKRRLPGLPFVKHMEVPREGLYATWNRGIALADSKYIAIWNVDDVRLPESLKDQADCLDENMDAAMCYGDFIIVDEYGKIEGQVINEPDFTNNTQEFHRKHHIGCFPMWRKNIHAAIGYFDEQFRLIADLDFQIRVAAKYPLVKVNTHLGYYLEGTPNNQSSNTRLQDMEHTALHMRYGNYDLLYLPHLFEALRQIRLSKLKWHDQYHKFDPWAFINLFHFFIRLPLFVVSLFRYPRHMARKHLKQYIYNLTKGMTKDKLSTTDS